MQVPKCEQKGAEKISIRFIPMHIIIQLIKSVLSSMDLIEFILEKTFKRRVNYSLQKDGNNKIRMEIKKTKTIKKVSETKSCFF